MGLRGRLPVSDAAPLPFLSRGVEDAVSTGVFSPSLLKQWTMDGLKTYYVVDPETTIPLLPPPTPTPTAAPGAQDLVDSKPWCPQFEMMSFRKF